MRCRTDFLAEKRSLNIVKVFFISTVDVLAQTLNSLRTEMMCEVSRGLYIHYGGVHVLLEGLRSGRAGLHTPIDILVQLTEQSRK